MRAWLACQVVPRDGSTWSSKRHDSFDPSLYLIKTH